MDISGEMLDSLAVFADDLSAHMQKDMDSIMEFPWMPGDVVDCSLGIPMEQKRSTSGMAEAQMAATSVASEQLPPSQDSPDAKGMEVDPVPAGTPLFLG